MKRQLLLLVCGAILCIGGFLADDTIHGLKMTIVTAAWAICSAIITPKKD